MKYKATITVKIKNDVRDAKGKTISDVLKNAGYVEDAVCRVGAFYEVDFDCENLENARQKADKIANEVFSNPAIEEYFVTVERSQKCLKPA